MTVTATIAGVLIFAFFVGNIVFAAHRLNQEEKQPLPKANEQGSP